MKRISFLSLAAVTCLTASTMAKDVTSILEVKSLSNADKVIAKELIKDIQSRLPEQVKKNLPKNLKLRFKSLNKNTLPVPSCSAKVATEQFRYGQFNNLFNTIELDRQLLDAYKNGEETTYNCKHRNLKRKSVAIVLHELFHAYDSSSFKKVSKYKGCPDFSHLSQKEKRKLTAKCKQLHRQYKRNRRVSKDIVFKGVTFWHGKNKNNFKGHRTADAYENTSEGEYAAVNFEYFMLDSEYKCRRPSHYKYFSEHLNTMPFIDEKCESSNQVIIKEKDTKLVNLDPKRIYQVHYLLAGAGEAAMSSFGHSMLRIIQCAPERKDPISGDIIPATPYGPECLKDYDYHVVASFRANINDLMINNVKGLFGGYPSQLYMLPLSEVITEYNKKEMRDLFSFPLRITRDQKEELISKMLEIYWEYKGSYKFFSANCATETYTLISAIFNDIKYHTPTSITPYGILDELVKTGLVSKRRVRNDFEKLEKHNIFRSNEFYLRTAYKNLKLTKKKINRDTIIDHIQSKADDRTVILDQIEERLNNEKSKGPLTRTQKKLFIKEVASFLILENQVLTTYLHEFQKTIVEKIVTLAENDEVDFNEKEYTSKFSQQAQDFLTNGYGIPVKHEVTNFSMIDESMVNIEKVADEFIEILRPYVEDEKVEAKKIEQNILRAKEIRKELKRRK